MCGRRSTALDVSVAPQCPPGPVPAVGGAGGVVGSSGVGDELAVDGVGDPALEAADGFEAWSSRRRACAGSRPGRGCCSRIWVVAAMWSMWLTFRFPARDSRWRICSPEEASRGAVPVQDANRFRLANRATSPTSARIRAATTGPTPGRSISRRSAGQDHDLELGGGGLDLLVDRDQLGDQLGGEPAAGLPGQVPGPHRGEDRLGLSGGQVLLRLARASAPTAAAGAG